MPFRVGVSLEKLYTGRLGSFSSCSTFSRVLIGVAFILRYYPILRSPLAYLSKVPATSVALIIARTFFSVSFFLSFNQLSFFPFPLPLLLYGNVSGKRRSAKLAIPWLRTSSLSLGFKRLYIAFLLLLASGAKRLPLASILFSPYRVTDLPLLRTGISICTRLILADYGSLIR